MIFQFIYFVFTVFIHLKIINFYYSRKKKVYRKCVYNRIKIKNYKKNYFLPNSPHVKFCINPEIMKFISQNVVILLPQVEKRNDFFIVQNYQIDKKNDVIFNFHFNLKEKHLINLVFVYSLDVQNNIVNVKCNKINYVS